MRLGAAPATWRADVNAHACVSVKAHTQARTHTYTHADRCTDVSHGGTLSVVRNDDGKRTGADITTQKEGCGGTMRRHVCVRARARVSICARV